MRIAYLTENILSQGDRVATTLANMIKHLEKSRTDFRIFSPVLSTSLPWGERVVQVNALPADLFPDENVARAIRLDFDYELDRFQPDLIHVMNPSRNSLLALNYAHEKQIPIVASYHSSFTFYDPSSCMHTDDMVDRSYLRWFHKRCKAIFVSSLHDACRLNQQGIDKIQIWASGVDTDLFSPRHRNDDFRQEIRKAGEPIVLYMLNNDNSDHDLLFDACNLLHRKGLAFTLVVAYQQSLPDEIKRKLPWAEFCQTRTTSELAKMYASVDLHILPHQENNGRQKLLEAAASGIPSVAFRVGWADEIVQDHETGLLAKLDNAQDFAAKMSLLILDPVMRERMAHNVLKEAQEFSWERSCNRLLGRYRSLISTSKTSATMIQLKRPRRSLVRKPPVRQLIAA